MKSIEQLKRLAQNPFYQMSDEEISALKEAEQGSSSQKKVSSKTKTALKGQEQVKGAAPVKETGKLAKHPSDPVSE